MINNDNYQEIFKKYFLEEIDSTWNDFFLRLIGEEEIFKLLRNLEKEWEIGPCYPERKNIFRLFRELPLSKINVVIIGQDPYHQAGIADGFAFSTHKKKFIPASLKNILDELSNDIGCQNKQDEGNLSNWVRQGVFLLNTSLTVRQAQRLSHSHLWKDFISKLLAYINDYSKNIVWVLWGREAKILSIKCKINTSLTISSSHPSPFSASYGFFGSKPFSNINQKLKSIDKPEISWCLE